MLGDSGGVGIYFLDGDVSTTPTVDSFPEIMAFAENLPGVKMVKNPGHDTLSPELLSEEIKQAGLKRVILTGQSPGFYKPLFTRAMVSAGNDPGGVEVVGFDQFGGAGLIGSDVDHAKIVLNCALLDIPFETAILPEENDVHPDTLVIGGGIAGIQASLEVADSGNKVFLVEKSGTIGGHMAMFDKTFPTLDCAACILTPKMVDVGQHPNIDLMTYCEVLEVNGEPGNYKVKVLKKSRRVDLVKCIGCGVCAEKCPGNTYSEFDVDTTTRKAIYIPFPQAVPNKYLIDEENCLYCQNGKCGVCAKICPAHAVLLDQKDETVEITVGNIIVATGFKIFDAKRAEQFGYGKFPNVLTSLEFERLVNAGGPTRGGIRFRSKDKKGRDVFEPKGDAPNSVALIHCVGSRDENYNKHCSKVCCMYSLKLAHLVKEKLPDAEVYEYYIDMRAFGKGYEEFYERIKSEDIHVIRGRTAKVEQENGKLQLRTEDMAADKIIEQDVDMVILAVGLEPRDDTGEIAQMLELERDSSGWFRETDYNLSPVDTYSGGVYVAGVCQGPKDIPDTVAQASAAAARVLQNIARGKVRKSSPQMSAGDIQARLNGNAGNQKEAAS